MVQMTDLILILNAQQGLGVVLLLAFFFVSTRRSWPFSDTSTCCRLSLDTYYIYILPTQRASTSSYQHSADQVVLCGAIKCTKNSQQVGYQSHAIE